MLFRCVIWIDESHRLWRDNDDIVLEFRFVDLWWSLLFQIFPFIYHICTFFLSLNYLRLNVQFFFSFYIFKYCFLERTSGGIFGWSRGWITFVFWTLNVIYYLNLKLKGDQIFQRLGFGWVMWKCRTNVCLISDKLWKIKEKLKCLINICKQNGFSILVLLSYVSWSNI